MIEKDFDLLKNDWIPCIQLDNEQRDFCIISALVNSCSIRAIHHESPVVTFSVLRFLLAFCYRVAYATKKPLTSFRNWRRVHEEWKNGIAQKDIETYLDECKCRDRFRLFDDRYPLYQVANLVCTGKEQPEPATRLFFEQFGGTPTQLWEHAPMLPTIKEAALYLISSQAFGASTSNTSKAKVGEIHYLPSGRTFAPCYKGCIVWLEGANLLETLLLNLVDYDMVDVDLPIWEKQLTIQELRARQALCKQEVNSEKKEEKCHKTFPTGPVQLFTWPSRAILLEKTKGEVVERVHFTQGLGLMDYPLDPMKPYDAEGRPMELDKNKGAWRDLHAILELKPNRNRTVLAFSHAARCGLSRTIINVAGVARGAKAAKILFWRYERFSVPVAMLEDVNIIDRIGTLVGEADNVEKILRQKAINIAYRYTVQANGRPDTKDQHDRNNDADKIAESIDPRPAYWARLEKHFFDLLQNLPNDWDTEAGDWKPDDQQHATRTWRKAVLNEARRSLEESVRSLGTTARAISAIARVGTDFSEKDLKPQPQDSQPKEKKSKPGKKGGGKNQMSLDEKRKSFIRRLLSLAEEGKEDRGALADLRSGLGKEPGKMARVHKHVVPYLPEKYRTVFLR